MRPTLAFLLLALAGAARADEPVRCDFEHDGKPFVGGGGSAHVERGKLTVENLGAQPRRILRYDVRKRGKAELAVTMSLGVQSDKAKIQTGTARVAAKVERRPKRKGAEIYGVFGDVSIDQTGATATGTDAKGRPFPANAAVELTKGVGDKLTQWAEAPIAVPFSASAVDDSMPAAEESAIATMRMAVVPLPAVPVGKGAVWRVRSRVASAMSMEIDEEYRYVDDEGGLPVIELVRNQHLDATTPRRYRPPAGNVVETERADNVVNGRVVLGSELPFRSAHLDVTVTTRTTECRGGMTHSVGMETRTTLRFDPTK